MPTWDRTKRRPASPNCYVNEWRGRIESEDANTFLDDLGRLPIRIEWEPSAGEREGPAPRCME